MNQLRGRTTRLRHILAVKRERDLRVFPVQVGLDPRAERARGIKAFRACPHRVGALQITQGHIVDARKTKHVIHGFLDRHVLRDPADDDSDFRFEIHVMRERRNDNRIVRADHRRARLRENHHILRRVRDLTMPRLMHELGVRLVVLRQAVNLGRDDRGEQTQAVRVERKTLAGRFHRLGAEWVAAEHHEIIFAVLLILLYEGVLRGLVVFGETCDSHIPHDTSRHCHNRYAGRACGDKPG